MRFEPRLVLNIDSGEDRLKGGMRTMRQIRALVLPLTALVVVPIFILAVGGSSVFGFNLFAPLFQVVIGLIVCIAGLKVMVVTIKMFNEIGEGTLAPWDPTKKLVTAGIYGHIRNPMITGVLAVLLGEAFLLGSLGVFIWAVVFFIANTLYFHYSEEKGLEERFGDEYKEYRQHVPMWFPRLHPWHPQQP